MPLDYASILRYGREIGSIINELTDEATSLSNCRREELIRNAERLAIAAREPEENLYYQATQTAQNSAIRTAIGMGVFERTPLSGDGISARDLAAISNVDERLLVRVMRACSSTHLFREISPSHYTHNAFSTIFLIPSNRDMFKQMYDFLGQGVYAMPHFLNSRGYQNPTEYHDSAFHYGHHTRLGFWEYLKADPERARLFNSGMRSLATVGSANRSAGPYPFGEELGTEEVRDTDVLVVDVGGGRGQVLEAIKASFPSLKGRMVLQDVPDVIEDAEASGLPGFIEPMAVSFFEPQPIEGALVYHFRRILHDWSDDVSLTILRNTIQAMGARSRILITDAVLPDTDAPRHMALQDINMMCFGGMERTRSQWEGLLGAAGLNVQRFWASDGNLQNTIEARVRV
ncbi:hypothetical protein MMC26_006003 [Xylographa opegraphella]|nr:hypothetical protein [Xylographa opegraphella]